MQGVVRFQEFIIQINKNEQYWEINNSHTFISLAWTLKQLIIYIKTKLNPFIINFWNDLTFAATGWF